MSGASDRRPGALHSISRHGSSKEAPSVDDRTVASLPPGRAPPERTSDMRSVVIHAPRDLRLEATAPGQPGIGQVAVRVAVGGICGSDLHYFNHGGFGTVRLQEPMILGHEISGTVTELGPLVTGLAVGSAVAV